MATLALLALAFLAAAPQRENRLGGAITLRSEHFNRTTKFPEDRGMVLPVLCPVRHCKLRVELAIVRKVHVHRGKEVVRMVYAVPIDLTPYRHSFIQHNDDLVTRTCEIPLVGAEQPAQLILLCRITGRITLHAQEVEHGDAALRLKLSLKLTSGNEAAVIRHQISDVLQHHQRQRLILRLNSVQVHRVRKEHTVRRIRRREVKRRALVMPLLKEVLGLQH